MNDDLKPLRDDPYRGSVIQGKYHIRRKLGAGGMGSVYEGEHVLIGRRVAIKILHPQLSQNAEAVRRFQLEARAATAIGHKHIVEVTDMGQLDDGTVFMVLEYLEGRDLKTELSRSGALPLDRTARIFSQICDALSAAHAKGIVHRDLKPENVYLIERDDDPDFVKVLDFGIAKFMADDGQSSSLTKTGMAIGTAFYMSPEQAQGKKDVDHRTDLFSLGVMLYEALAGKRPFDDESQVQLMMAICLEAPPPVSKLRPDLPEELVELLNHLLEKKPGDRPRDGAAVKTALAPWLDRPSVAPAARAQPLDLPSPTASPLPAVIQDQGGTLPSWQISKDPPPSEEPTAATEAVPEVEAHDEPDVSLPTEEPAPPSEEEAPATVDAPAEPTEEEVESVEKPADPEVISASPSADTRHSAAASPQVASPRRWVLPAVGAVVVFLAGIGAAAVINSNAASPRAPESIPAAQIETPDDSQPPSVRIEIEVLPHEAELFLDDEPVANPFDAQLPRQDEPRRLEARLAGHGTIHRQISMRFPQRIRLEMQPLASDLPDAASLEVPGDAVAAPTKRSRRPEAREPTEAEAPAPPRIETAVETAPAPTVDPDEERRRQRLKRGVF